MKRIYKRQQFLIANVLSCCLLAVFSISNVRNAGADQIPGKNDRIGWSADGNFADEDDWAATAMTLAIFAKMGWQDELVHFDYNNRLDRSHEWKEIENYESTIGGAQRFGFNEKVFFNDQTELEAAIEHAKDEINKSHEGSKFWYVQAGPFEVSYQALLRADAEKRQYCILVSHSEINEQPGKWKLQDGSASHGKDDCVALGAKYFFTTNQYNEKFGGRKYKRWDLVEWMKESCEEYSWVHTRFLATAKHKDDGLDASDGGMAFALATGDLDGNFTKLRDFLGADWSVAAAQTGSAPANDAKPLFRGGPLLAIPGEVLIDDPLNGELEKGPWLIRFGDWDIHEDSWRSFTFSPDEHASVMRWVTGDRVELRDIIFEVEFCFQGATHIGVSIDSVEKHMFRIAMTPDSIMFMREDRDKNGPDKNELFGGKINAVFEKDAWYYARIEMVGDEVLGYVTVGDGDETVIRWGSHDLLSDKKEDPGFTVKGEYGAFRNARLRRATLNPDWESKVKPTLPAP